MLSHFKTLLKI